MVSTYYSSLLFVEEFYTDKGEASLKPGASIFRWEGLLSHDVVHLCGQQFTSRQNGEPGTHCSMELCTIHHFFASTFGIHRGTRNSEGFSADGFSGKIIPRR